MRRRVCVYSIHSIQQYPLYLGHSSRIRFLRFFLKSKKRDFLRFFEAAFLRKKNVKNVIQNSEFQTLLTFHYMESPIGPYSSKTMYVYNLWD